MLKDLYPYSFANAASSVASSIQAIIASLSANVIQAFRPQIVKNYSQNNKISDSIYVNNIREDSPKIEKLPDYEYDDSKQELDIFYNRFIDRDNEFSGKLRDYLIQIM